MRRNRIMFPFKAPIPPSQVGLPSANAFVLVPLSCLPSIQPLQWLWQEAIYRKAREQAEAVVRPSLPERDLLAVWN